MIEFHKKWITNSCLIIKENCQKINMLDQEIGDGDHGTTILRGLEEAYRSEEHTSELQSHS